MDLTPGLRRDALPDPSDAGEDAELVARIRAEIERDGPIPFARFMDLALYDPDGGYYRSEAARPGREGDFLTAPETHPIFGWAIARVVTETWRRLHRPDRFVVRELGAGAGTLGLALLDGLDRLEEPALSAGVRYQPVEVEPRRLDGLAERFAAEGASDRLELAPSAGPITGVILGNEVLDALPVHRVRRRGHALRELAVGLDGDAFVEVEIEPTTPALADRLAAEAIELVDGQTAEVCLALDPWLAEVAASLDRGLLLLIDYGHPAAQLYDPIRRRDGTLRAYVRHAVHDDPYRHVGRQDLTAHVDVTAVGRAAVAAGMEPVGTTTQAEFLVGAGAEADLRRVQEDPATRLEDYLALRSGLFRLLDPAATGRFAVMAFGRDLPATEPLPGFAFRLPGR